eukprot:Skav200839  [mRNA]  locus=scaffold2392:39496:41371:- [translate_table: standard]
MSLTSFLMAFLHHVLSTGSWAIGAVFFAVSGICFAQGVGQALYMAANTTLISRRFTAVAYVVGMAEVAVGFGAQLGRLAGGGLYDLGGFASVAYVVGMAEVAVGFGAQLGRLAGGGLYDLGGFACPFLTASALLSCTAAPVGQKPNGDLRVQTLHSTVHHISMAKPKQQSAITTAK